MNKVGDIATRFTHQRHDLFNQAVVLAINAVIEHLDVSRLTGVPVKEGFDRITDLRDAPLRHPVKTREDVLRERTRRQRTRAAGNVFRQITDPFQVFDDPQVGKHLVEVARERLPLDDHQRGRGRQIAAKRIDHPVLINHPRGELGIALHQRADRIAELGDGKVAHGANAGGEPLELFVEVPVGVCWSHRVLPDCKKRGSQPKRPVM
jgi:hypothetical protein